jgi:hypothetical protein
VVLDVLVHVVSRDELVMIEAGKWRDKLTRHIQ